MSTTLILNAGTASPVNLVVQTAGEGAPGEVGSITQSFNGADRSSVRGVKRNYGSLTTYLDTASKDAVINLLKGGNQIPCSGDLLANIQTQCSVRYTGCRMIQGTATGLWEVGLSLNEVQPSVTLLRYAPGDTITGESFSRATVGYSVSSNGTVVSNAINVKRDSHYIGGVRSLLLEDARINSCIWCRDLTNAAWTKTNCTAALTSVGADGNVNSATRVTATAGNGTVSQTITLGSSARYQSAYIKRITGTGTIQMSTDGGATWAAVVPTAGWTRLTIPTQTLANPTVAIRLVTSGDAIDVDFVQNEGGTFPSSPILTTTVPFTRSAEFYSLPFTAPPQELTAYVKWVDQGTIATLNAVLALVAANAAPAPYFFLESTGTTAIRVFHNNATATVFSDASVGAAFGDTCEVRANLFGDGSVLGAGLFGAGSEIAGAQSGAQALGFATAWSGLLAWLNGTTSGSTLGFAAIRSFKILAGSRSLAELRAA